MEGNRSSTPQFDDSVQVRSLSSGWFLLYFLDLSAFPLISDSRFFVIRSIRIRAALMQVIHLGR